MFEPIITIFKKIHIFSALENYEKKFYNHLILNLDRSDENHELKNLTPLYNFPTWEIEKKILMWSYFSSRHTKPYFTKENFLNEVEKYRIRNIQSSKKNFNEKEIQILKKTSSTKLKQELEEMKEGYEVADETGKQKISKAFPENMDLIRGQSKDVLKDMLLTQNEVLNVGIENFLNNLIFKKLIKKKKDKYYVTKKGLDYGEIIWYLYNPFVYREENKFIDFFAKSPVNLNRDKELIICKLERQFLPHVLVYKFLIFNFYLLILYLVLLIGFSMMHIINYFQSFEAKILSLNLFNYLDVKIVLSLFFFLPPILLITSLISHFIYSRFILNKKHAKIETIKEELYSLNNEIE
jgi:hypothetical protein